VFTGVRSGSRPPTKDMYPFTIHHAHSKKTYTFYTGYPSGRNGWINALSREIYARKEKIGDTVLFVNITISYSNLSSGCSYIHTKSLTRTFSSCLRAPSRSPTERTLLVGPFVWLSFVGYSVFSSLSLLMRLSAFQGEHHLAVGCANGIYFRTRDRVSDSRMSLKHFSRFSF